MTTLGGAGISCLATTTSVLGSPASLIESELPPHPRYGAPALLSALLHQSAWRNCLEKRAGWVDDVRSRAWRSAIRPICLTMSGSVWSSSCRLPTSEDDRGPTAPARSLTPSSTS